VLRRLAAQRPRTARDLARVTGFTRAMASKFGPALLNVMEDYSRRGEPSKSGSQELEGSGGEVEDGATELADISLNMNMTGVSEVAEDSGPEQSEQASQCLATLVTILPEVDLAFLREKAGQIGEDEEALQGFIASALERRTSLPSRREQEQRAARRGRELAIRKLGPKDFIAEFEDPHQHFLLEAAEVGESYRQHALHYIAGHFPGHQIDMIEKVLAKHKGHFVPSIKAVEKMKGKAIINQKDRPKKPKEMDLGFLKEYVYYKLETKIRK
jgi:hypothetical protein